MVLDANSIHLHVSRCVSLFRLTHFCTYLVHIEILKRSYNIEWRKYMNCGLDVQKRGKVMAQFLYIAVLVNYLN
jgi:hypothetical protein